jgi:hypothetical protein
MMDGDRGVECPSFPSLTTEFLIKLRRVARIQIVNRNIIVQSKC